MIEAEQVEQYLIGAVRIGLIRTWWHQQNDWFIMTLDGEAMEYDRAGITEYIYLLTRAGVNL